LKVCSGRDGRNRAEDLKSETGPRRAMFPTQHPAFDDGDISMVHFWSNWNGR
jgi:hypothetical protein